MTTRTHRTSLAIAATLLATAAAASPTQRCNPEPQVNSVFGEYDNPADPTMQAVISAIRSPASNPQLYERLARPIDVRTSHIITPMITIEYEPVQDITEIHGRLRADANLLAPLNYLAVNGIACFSPPPPPVTQVITEYYNVDLNHYFMSSSPEENASIDGGGAGPGWKRTGHAWQTYRADFCSAPVHKSVYRFYGTPGVGPNSHFYTVNPDECGGLRRGVGWGFEGFAFGAAVPVNGVCPTQAPVPLMRLYNDRFAFNDSNHRYTSDPLVYSQMQSQGWIGEGVQLCVNRVGVN